MSSTPPRTPRYYWEDFAVGSVREFGAMTVTREAMLAFAREHLAGYKLPRSISFADEIPRNASGKILKKVLREPFWAGRERRVG